MYKYSRPKTLSQILLEWGEIWGQSVIIWRGSDLQPRRWNGAKKSATKQSFAKVCDWEPIISVTLDLAVSTQEWYLLFKWQSDTMFSSSTSFLLSAKRSEIQNSVTGIGAVWHDRVFRLEMKWICRFYECYQPFGLKPSSPLCSL